VGGGGGAQRRDRWYDVAATELGVEAFRGMSPSDIEEVEGGGGRCGGVEGKGGDFEISHQPS
jgi:hypothetical protein